MPTFPFRRSITVVLTNAEFIVPILQVGTPRPGFVPWLHDNKLCDFGKMINSLILSLLHYKIGIERVPASTLLEN